MLGNSVNNLLAEHFMGSSFILYGLSKSSFPILPLPVLNIKFCLTKCFHFRLYAWNGNIERNRINACLFPYTSTALKSVLIHIVCTILPLHNASTLPTFVGIFPPPKLERKRHAKIKSRQENFLNRYPD